MRKNDLLLMILPFWSPFNPPLGISNLKGYLQRKGFLVKIVDANTNKDFWIFYEKYVAASIAIIPEDKQANFKNNIQGLLRYHITSYINKTNRNIYIKCIKQLFEWHYFYSIDEKEIIILDEIVEGYLCLIKEFVIKLIEENQPSVVGFSIFSTTFPSSLFASKIIKENYPDIKIIAGGGMFSNQFALGSPDLEYFLEKTKNLIDHIFIGEGELLLEKYLNNQLAKKMIYTLVDIDQQYINLEEDDNPDFSDLEINKYLQIIISGSRSCPYQCKFCSETVYWGKYRKICVDKIIRNIIKFKDQYNPRVFIFSDSLINPIIEDLTKELSRLKLSVYFDSHLKVDNMTCNAEKVKFWFENGFIRARLGIESGSPEILQKIDKRNSVEQIKKTIINLSNAGIKTTIYIIVGFPGETDHNFKETLELVEELKDHIYELEFNSFYYYPSGQVNSEDWGRNGVIPIFSDDTRELVLVNRWELKGDPKREVILKRMNILSLHLKALGIPTTYNYIDILKADKRWKRLHPQSVSLLAPSLEKL